MDSGGRCSWIRFSICCKTVVLHTYNLNATDKQTCPFTTVKKNIVLTKSYSTIERTRWEVYRECIVWSVKNRIKYNQKGKRDFKI
jgi:hypothetical protein